MSHTQPASDATKTAMPSHTTGWWYHADPAWSALSRLVVINRVRPVIDIRCKYVDLVLAQARSPGRHVALATVVDGLADVRLGATVKPGSVSEVRRAQRGIAGAVGAVAYSELVPFIPFIVDMRDWGLGFAISRGLSSRNFELFRSNSLNKSLRECLADKLPLPVTIAIFLSNFSCSFFTRSLFKSTMSFSINPGPSKNCGFFIYIVIYCNIYSRLYCYCKHFDAFYFQVE